MYRAAADHKYLTWRMGAGLLAVLAVLGGGLAAWTVSGAGQRAEATLEGHERAHAQELRAIDSRLGLVESKVGSVDAKVDRILERMPSVRMVRGER